MASKYQIKKIMELLYQRDVKYHEVDEIITSYLEEKADIIAIVKIILNTKRSAVKRGLIILEEEK